MALRFDPRVLMTVGCSALLWSMWDMSGWTPQISDGWLIFVTFVQGIGMGFVFVPMNLTAFATLPGQYRTDGTAMTNLSRNIGSAIGVSVTTAVLGGSAQIAHALLTNYATGFNRALGINGPGMMMNPQLPFGAQNLNGLIEYRAQVIAFQNDFLFMFYLSLPALLVIWMMKRPQFAQGAPKPEVEVME
jgi:DHA2 family multidrug resistance protein